MPAPAAPVSGTKLLLVVASEFRIKRGGQPRHECHEYNLAMNKVRLQIRRTFPNVRAVTLQSSLLIRAVGQNIVQVQISISGFAEGDCKVWLSFGP